MTTSSMPMMLEDHINALGGALPSMDDDLFGDEVLPMAHRPPSKQLQQRVDELRSHGCCRTLAYSKQGVIASISTDGTHVNLQCPRTNQSDGSWELGESLPCTLLPPPLPGVPLIHLVWAPTVQPELAVIDAFGRVCLITLGVHANKAAYISRKWDADAQDDLHSVVGCFWLPLQPNPRMMTIVWGPAVKDNDKYSYQNSVYQSPGPFHPNASRSSFVCVTAGGILKLFFTQNSNQVQDIHLEMESITSSDDLITHAAICSEKGKLLIVLATAAKQLKVISAVIDWGVANPPHDKQIPGGSLPLRPSLKIEHVTTTSWLQQGWAESHLDASMDQISHLELLPPALELKTRTSTPGMILAVRVHIPTAESHYNMEYESIIDSWDVVTDRPQQLHPAFEQRGSKAGSASTPGPLIVLHKRNSIVISNKVIVSVETSLHSKIICIGFSDGTVQYRDRITLAEILPEEQYTPMTVLRQAGFHFLEEQPSLQTSFSPNLCAVAQMRENGKINWNSLQYPVAQIGADRPDPLYDAVLAGLTMTTANSTHQNSNYDDILAVARPLVDHYPGFLRDWVKNLVLMLTVNVDYSDEAAQQENLVRNMQWLFAMSVLNHFGFKGWFRPRTFNGKFTMLGLSIRNIVIMMTLANNSPPVGPMRERVSPLDEPEVIHMLSGCAQWSVDLLSWVTDGLFGLRDDPKFREILQTPASFSEMTSHLKAKNEACLHLILCSTTRVFLTAICKRLTHLQALCHKAQEYWWNAADKNPTPAHRALQRAYMKLLRATTTNLVKITEFEALLGVMSEGVRQTYHNSFAALLRNVQQQQQQQQQQPLKPGQPTPGEVAVKKATAQCETLIFFGEQPPPGFQPLLKRFFETDLERVMGSTKRFDLFFTDFPLLEVEDDTKRLAARKADGRFVDVFKRVEVLAPKLVKGGDGGSKQQQDNGEDAAAAGSTFRRCVRCCAIMEDVPSTNLRPGYNFIVAQQRKCLCGGTWAFLP